MSTLVHASSLASVSQIASNPPAYPHIQSDNLESPLVLYIARVPGSRDVFLTPLKPRDRVVTAEDVQSSLYYIHVNSAQDFESQPPPLPHRRSSVDTDASFLLPGLDKSTASVPPLPRRPEGSTLSPRANENGESGGSQVPPHQQLKRKTITRKPVASGNANNAASPQAHTDSSRLPSRPLPPLPSEHTPSDVSLREETVRLLMQTNHANTVNPYAQTYPTGEDTWVDPALRPASGSLTLIRRDPSTNEQWNVALIHDPPIHEVSPTSPLSTGSTERIKRSAAPLYLNITNPAYAQFLSAEQINHSQPRPSSSYSDRESAPPGTFQRTLYLPGLRAAEQPFRSAKHRLSVAGPHESGITTTVPDKFPGVPYRRSNKGYTFASAWPRGRCEFSTGAAGRSLKCRHYHPHNRSARAQQYYEGNEHGAEVMIEEEVSELRFNLPPMASKAISVASSAAMPGEQKRGSYLRGLHVRLRSNDMDADSEDLQGEWKPSMVLDENGRIDLSLGQERAGGGFGGRQAKLGKLIIEPAGLKMLDLLVAANVGLWWRAYERQ